MAELSVIIPYVNEWPQIVFTVGSIYEELIDRVDFEIILVDNWCAEVETQGRTRDHGHPEGGLPGQSWLKVVQYSDKLSHWQAKNAGIAAASGDIIWFCDAHCIVCRDSLFGAYEYYRDHWQEINGTLHLPLHYQILDNRRLIYALVTDPAIGHYHYKFTTYQDWAAPYAVPCMSSCGMFMHREVFNALGGFPEGLGIYGGGENFVNFTLAVLGMNKMIYPCQGLRHHGDKRGYNWNYTDHLKNRAIATYIFGGELILLKFLAPTKGRDEVKAKIMRDVIEENRPRRERIKSMQTTTIDEWVQQWT